MAIKRWGNTVVRHLQDPGSEPHRIRIFPPLCSRGPNQHSSLHAKKQGCRIGRVKSTDDTEGLQGLIKLLVPHKVGRHHVHGQIISPRYALCMQRILEQICLFLHASTRQSSVTSGSIWLFLQALT
eukprot:558189-Rhodomonas_salina.3